MRKALLLLFYFLAFFLFVRQLHLASILSTACLGRSFSKGSIYIGTCCITVGGIGTISGIVLPANSKQSATSFIRPSPFLNCQKSQDINSGPCRTACGQAVRCWNQLRNGSFDGSWTRVVTTHAPNCAATEKLRHACSINSRSCLFDGGVQATLDIGPKTVPQIDDGIAFSKGGEVNSRCSIHAEGRMRDHCGRAGRVDSQNRASTASCRGCRNINIVSSNG
mmetsp:Transcript_33735/g.99399  ORF Transcript_33735/g.99399 Transcript_33735/m.99399 type:complete len:222 (-) Transcript_33735:1769-2434(-)